jgi:PEP-CTERM motif
VLNQKSIMKPLVTLLVLLALSLAADGASFSTNATADAFVTTGPSGNLSGNNYGGAGAIALAADGLPQGEFQSVLRFNLAGSLDSFNDTFGAGQWSIQSVTLQLNAATANNAIFNAPAAGQFGIAWLQNDSWTEGTGGPAAPGATGITYASLQNTFQGLGDQSLGTFSFNGATNGAFAYSLTLMSGLTGDIFAGDNLSLRLFAADSSVSAVFNSRTFGTLANRPLLTIVAVPEPGTIALGIMCLVSMGAWRCVNRRR